MSGRAHLGPPPQTFPISTKPLAPRTKQGIVGSMPKPTQCGAVLQDNLDRKFVCTDAPHPDDPGSHFYQQLGLAKQTSTHLESGLEAFFRQEVRLHGGMMVKLAPMQAGIPDRLVVLPGGKMHLIELKSESGRLSAIQEEWHRRISKLGAKVTVLTGRTEVLEWVRLEIEAAGPRSRTQE